MAAPPVAACIAGFSMITLVIGVLGYIAHKLYERYTLHSRDPQSRKADIELPRPNCNNTTSSPSISSPLYCIPPPPPPASFSPVSYYPTNTVVEYWPSPSPMIPMSPRPLALLLPPAPDSASSKEIEVGSLCLRNKNYFERGSSSTKYSDRGGSDKKCGCDGCVDHANGEEPAWKDSSEMDSKPIPQVSEKVKLDKDHGEGEQKEEERDMRAWKQRVMAMELKKDIGLEDGGLRKRSAVSVGAVGGGARKSSDEQWILKGKVMERGGVDDTLVAVKERRERWGRWGSVA